MARILASLATLRRGLPMSSHRRRHRSNLPAARPRFPRTVLHPAGDPPVLLSANPSRLTLPSHFLRQLTGIDFAVSSYSKPAPTALGHLLSPSSNGWPDHSIPPSSILPSTSWLTLALSSSMPSRSPCPIPTTCVNASGFLRARKSASVIPRAKSWRCSMTPRACSSASCAFPLHRMTCDAHRSAFGLQNR